ncbi:MAG: sensor histidine kinase [Oscillospiraceae bacterium]
MSLEKACGVQQQKAKGSIHRKLTMFVVVLCLFLVMLFYTFAVLLLQPVYNNTIKKDLGRTLNTVVGIINDMQKEGIPLATIVVSESSDVATITVSEEFKTRLSAAVDAGTLTLDNRCLDISVLTSSYSTRLFLYDRLSKCYLHPIELGFSVNGGSGQLIVPDSDIVAGIRNIVAAQGYYEGTLGSEGSEQHQMVLGQRTTEGYSVIVSANLERIAQAGNVLRSLLLPISMALMFLGINGAWIFSHWFTRPLNRLSAAARKMAKGDYDVEVATHGDDEIATLTEDFNAMAKEVKRSAELQKDLLANISHDLRTPLTLIKGYAETVRDLSGEDPQKRTEQLNVIVDETDRLSALVNSVLELSRVSSGNEKLEPVRFSLCQLCDEVAYRYEVFAKKNNLTFDFSSEGTCEVFADPMLLERVLHNLLGNAVQHVGEDGYVGLRVFMTESKRVRLEVTDHGKGISEEDIPHLFERYYRSRSDSGKPGTGLGLSIVKAILDAHYANYGVNSKPGEGAVFWFELPLAK